MAYGRNTILNFSKCSSEYIHYPKMRVKYLPKTQLNRIYDDDKVLAAKLDGALTHLYIRNDGPSSGQSHRISKRTLKPIDYTPKIKGLSSTTLPDGLGKEKDLRGELVILDSDRKVLPHQEISGILNSNVSTAIKKIEEKNLRPAIALFDIWNDNRDYKEKIIDLRRIADHNPNLFFVPDIATTKKEKEKLVNIIEAGKHPLTNEGVILDGKFKVKFRRIAPVYVHSFYDTVTPGSKLEDYGVGGFWYSLEKNGPPVGKVGTGFSESQRREFFNNRRKFLGKAVVIEHQGQYPMSGAYRAPSFKGFI